MKSAFGGNIKKIAIGLSAGAIMLGASVLPAFAAYSLFGDASIVPGGNPGNAAQIRSDVSVTPGYGGVEILISPTSWVSLATLSTGYNVTDDNCGGGSPRVSLGVDTNSDNVADGYVHIAIGPSPSFTGCTAGWQTTGNLIGNSDAGRYDYSQFGGSPFTTYSGAPASVTGGNVVEAFVVVDGSWSAAATGGDSEQTVLVDNLTFNTSVETFDPAVASSKDECKNGGWMDLVDDQGNSFKNQGDCVSYVATGGKNLGAGE